jgi:hypothetical protein
MNLFVSMVSLQPSLLTVDLFLRYWEAFGP